MVFCEGDVVVGVYVMDGVIICVGVNVWVIKLQVVVIIVGSVIKLLMENVGEGLLRDIIQVYCDIKNWMFGGV